MSALLKQLEEIQAIAKAGTMSQSSCCTVVLVEEQLVSRKVRPGRTQRLLTDEWMMLAHSLLSL
jgi:hypothetical protein